MSTQLDPKTVPADAWKQWHRDSFRMWKRTGLFWQMGFILLMTGVAAGASQLLAAHAAFVLLLIPGLVALGFAMIPIQFRALERARRGEQANPWEDLALGGSETLSHPRWWMRGAGVALMWVAGILMVSSLASMGARDPSVAPTPERASSLAEMAAALVVYATLYLWALKPRGFLGMDYFLEVKWGLDRALAKKLEAIAGFRNAPALLMASVSLAGIAIAMITLLAIASRHPHLSALGLVAFPLFTWHCAGVCLCAWHDIFDPDGGLAERQRVVPLQPAHLLSA